MGISGSLRSWSTCHLNVPASQLYAMFQLWIHSTLTMDANGATLSILWPLSRLLSKRLPALWCKAQQCANLHLVYLASMVLASTIKIIKNQTRTSFAKPSRARPSEVADLRTRLVHQPPSSKSKETNVKNNLYRLIWIELMDAKNRITQAHIGLRLMLYTYIYIVTNTYRIYNWVKQCNKLDTMTLVFGVHPTLLGSEFSGRGVVLGSPPPTSVLFCGDTNIGIWSWNLHPQLALPPNVPFHLPWMY